MHILITTAALALLTVAMLLLQIYWLRLPPRLRSLLIRAAMVMIVLHGLFVVTKWNSTSDRLNVFINWMAIAGYELLLFLFSRLSPRWLTIPSTIILLVPLFAASVLLPLTDLFNPGSNQIVPLGDHLFYEINPWANTGGGNGGVDLDIYHRPAFAPFLRHKIQTITFGNQECNAEAAFAIASPSTKTVLGRCPNWPSQAPGTFDRTLPLP
jgi:hypothetical protein